MTANSVSLRYGFNFLVADCATADGTTNDGSYLFLLNVAQEPLGCCIAVLCIHPQHTPPKEMQCELSYSCHVPVNSRRGGQKLIKHYQEYTFAVGCTDLSGGLPKPDECFEQNFSTNEQYFSLTTNQYKHQDKPNFSEAMHA
jgi:E3 ubiquitin-protein ligase SIAH1